MVKVNVAVNLDQKAIKDYAEKIGKNRAQDIAATIYRRSQEACPVRTGDLKESGYVKEIKNGAQVGYSASYAADINQLPQNELASGQAHFFTNAVIKTVGGI